MNLRSSSMIAATACLALVAASACADGAPTPRTAKSTASSSHAAPMTAAARKPNDSGVAIQYRVEGAAAKVGRPISVVLQFDGVSDPAGATARLTTDAGLTLTTSSNLTLPAGQSTTATVTVTSDREGLAYLNVFVTQNGAMSIVAIPIQTGSVAPAMKAAGEMKSSAEGEKIISMPAKEPK
ncbi:MAG TPA: hypothetical protein VF534_09435 [Paraburkholderia sp.]